MGWHQSMVRLDKAFREKHTIHCLDWGGSDIYVARNFCLAYPDERWTPYPSKHKEYKPFNGKLKYEKILWIDSDISFMPEDVENLISHGDSYDIVSGCVKVDFNSFALKYFGKMTNADGSGYEYSSEVCEIKLKDGVPFDAFDQWKKTANEEGLVEVDTCGGAFMCVRPGVYEAMEFPWYRVGMKDGIGQLSLSEDMAFCVRAKEAGFKIWADPLVRPVHDKPVPLR